MGLKTFLSAAFSAGTVAANTFSEGINAISGVTEIIGEGIQDFKKSSAYEREKENALERARTDLYYAKQFVALKKEMKKYGITDLTQARDFFDKMKKQIKEDEDDNIDISDVNLS